MDVEHPVLEVAGDQQVFQIPTHDNQLSTGLPNRIEHRIGMIPWIIKIAAPDDLRRNARCGGELKSTGVFPGADHESKLDRQRSGISFLDQVAQRGPTTGDKNRDREQIHKRLNGQGERNTDGERRTTSDTIR